MDVAAWLRSLGLGQYEQAFREHDIDAGVLAELTGEDLIGLGVTSIGHRRKLLAAISGLNNNAAPAVSPPGEAAARVTAPARPLPEAERRQLTVMFVDLVDSTGRACRLDPEEMGELLRRYQAAVNGAIARFEGHIAKYMGDGILAYFGYPRAHEDDAERAIRAGLAAAAAVGELDPVQGKPLAARIGIATGPVVVGELIGEGAAREQTVVGDTPNLAARLQTLAAPGAVVIGPRTRQLIGGLFDLAKLGSHTLKGFPTPVKAWRVLGQGRAESRFEALHKAGLTPLVGREHEIGLLLERWERTTEGDGQVVLLAGEPGIGKSRLVRDLRTRLKGQPHLNLSYHCSPHHRNSPLHPVIEQLERAAGLPGEVDPAAKLDRLEALLTRWAGDPQEVLPVIAALLSIDATARYPALPMSPHWQKERTLEVLVDQLLGVASKQPVLAIYEDVNWADPTSLELLDLVVNRIQDSAVLALIAFRPDFQCPWTRYAYVTSLTLSRLSRRQGAAMIERLTGHRPLPAPLREQILSKTDGVPLFVEELTKAVLEADLSEPERDHAGVASPLPVMTIPATLEESLLSRLDRLAPSREVAQLAAAIGREFAHELLVAASSLPESDLQDALDDLIEAGLVYRRGTPPSAVYSFKHALVRDAAYATLVRSKRQLLHRRIATALEQRFPESVRGLPELLAHHQTEAGQLESAVDSWLRAGQRAIAQSAMTEALTHIRKGLELLGGLSPSEQSRRQELDLRIALSVALMAAQGWAAPEAGRANDRARELCEEIGATSQLWPVLYGQWVFRAVRAEHDAARVLSAQMLSRAEEHADPNAVLVGHRICGTGAMWRGEPSLGRWHLEQALSRYDPEQHSTLAGLYVQDPRVAALSGLSWVLFALGHPTQAWSCSRAACENASALGHSNTMAYALLFGCFLAQFRRDAPEADRLARTLMEFSKEQNFPHYLGAGMTIRGWALAATGDPEAGLALLGEGLPTWSMTGASLYEPYSLSLLAEAHRAAGQANQALELLDQASAKASITGERFFAAELHRLKGDLLLELPTPNVRDGEASLTEAVAIARRQGAPLWELRAATSLARMRIEQGRYAEASGLLEPLVQAPGDGDRDVPDLDAARQLLCVLQGSGTAR